MVCVCCTTELGCHDATVPRRSYSAWRINPAHLRPKELNAFIETAATLERTATSPLTIKVIGRDRSWAAAMTALLLKGGMSPYLSLVADSDV